MPPPPPIATSPQSDPINQQRSPLGLGKWTKPDAQVDLDFAKDLFYSEPHLHRRRIILKKYPEIVKLYGTAMETFYIAALVAGCQVLLAYLFGVKWNHHSSDADDAISSFVYWTGFITVALVIGGSLSAMVGVIVHEACHNLVHKNTMVNRMTGFISNIPMLVPVAASFKRYHLEHHVWQGVKGKDPDLPLDWEIALIRGNFWMKFCWICVFPAMYGVRGFVLGRSMTKWENINTLFIAIVDICLYAMVGWRGLGYLALSVWFGYSFHPAAAHFIQEHYTFTSAQETTSYYGSLNWFFLNIGLHNEHHDFPAIPWTMTWALRHVAKEFYEPLVAFQSWITVHYKFLVDPSMGPVSRVARTVQVHKTDRKLLK